MKIKNTRLNNLRTNAKKLFFILSIKQKYNSLLEALVLGQNSQHFIFFITYKWAQ
jgi:hypothetical protein